MKKRIYIIYGLIFFLVLSTNVSWAFNKNSIPSMIRIGLKYGDTSVSQVNLKSTSGFEFGYYDGNQFYSVFNLMDEFDIVLKKDEYYKIQIGSTFSNKEDMENLLESLGDIPCYPVLDNGWKVWTGLFESKEEAEEFIINNGSFYDKKVEVVNPNSGSVVVQDKTGIVIFMYNCSKREYNFRPFLDKDGNDIISLDGKRYRGEFIIRRFKDSDMTVINYLSLESYLYGVLPKEMSGDWPMEALKAQAVAARSYAISSIHKHEEFGFNLCSTTNCQVYGGYDAERPRSNRAVDETFGEVLTYDGKIISPFYHSSSGGYTEDSENVWSIELPYIRAVKDDFSLGAPNCYWTKSYTAQEIKDILNSAGLVIGDIKEIHTEGYTEGGRILSLKISDGTREIDLAKAKTRSIFGPKVIKSMNFSISTDVDYYVISADMENIIRRPMSSMIILSADRSEKTSSDKKYRIFDGDDYITSSGVPTKYIFNGTGYGHGLGMSQWGAKKMAELGYTYEDILKHYYTGIMIE
ncbi:SpoIID/LytB domain-containing protein [Paramaledivibacter caminithermalis]|jgi:stage II sporulation protein D|uniref:Stage II sporulation protein D n=1 Tax=Paramaledivibacter caminithermalis (strain DSM 15212 / CIP 107654 / DViRD3) TaxID=1121301 RepID=A0A1M6QUG5_PARC5|nr:SpoIID/LytB domain-containing protein [Paramaledivibacter caminithermalis]SHK23959.1 stage II sporulation protein D [Paramaledivibacter caminithermalis DSM 15212]